MNTDTSSRESQDTVSTLLFAVTALLARTWFLVVSTTVVGLLGALLIVNLPETFTASTTVLVGSKSSSASGAMSLLKESGLGSLLGNIGSEDANTPVLKTLLGTRELAVWATRRYKLDSVWSNGESLKKPMRIENQVRNWQGNFGWKELDEGGFELTFQSSSPQLSYEVVQGVVFWLDSTFRGISKQSGAIRERYLDSRLRAQERVVDSLQDSLAAYQIRNRILVPSVQMEGLVKGAGDLEVEAERIDLEMRTMAASLGRDNSKIQQMAYARDQTRSAAQRLLERDGAKSLIKGLRPGVMGAIEVQRMQRVLQVQGAIYGFLLQQKEQISLDITKDIPSLTIVDPPILPKKRTSPPRFILMQAILMLWILGASTWIVVADALRRNPLSPELRSAWLNLLDAVPLKIGSLIQLLMFGRGTEHR